MCLFQHTTVSISVILFKLNDYINKIKIIIFQYFGVYFITWKVEGPGAASQNPNLVFTQNSKYKWSQSTVEVNGVDFSGFKLNLGKRRRFLGFTHSTLSEEDSSAEISHLLLLLNYEAPWLATAPSPSTGYLLFGFYSCCCRLVYLRSFQKLHLVKITRGVDLFLQLIP